MSMWAPVHLCVFVCVRRDPVTTCVRSVSPLRSRDPPWAGSSGGNDVGNSGWSQMREHSFPRGLAETSLDGHALGNRARV